MKKEKEKVIEEKRISSPSELEEGIASYFSSISKHVRAKEKYETGEVTSKGEPVYAIRDAEGDKEEPIFIRKWFAPPSVSGLCLFLGISKRELSSLASREEYAPVISRAELVFDEYTEQMLCEGNRTGGLLSRLDKRTELLSASSSEKDAEEELTMAERREILKLIKDVMED